MIVPAREDALEMTIDVSDPANEGRRQRGDRNVACWQAHAREIYQNHRGRYVGFAGGELFVDDTAQAARGQAQAAHPDDDAALVIYVPKQRMQRIYTPHGQF